MQHKGLHRRVMYMCVNYLLNMYAKCGAQRILGECSKDVQEDAWQVFKGCPHANVVIVGHVKCGQAHLATQLSQHSWVPTWLYNFCEHSKCVPV